MTGPPSDFSGTSSDPADGESGSADQHLLLAAGQRLVELSLEQLWMRHFALGGNTGLVELEAYLAGMMPLPELQRDLLAQAVNERLDELHDAARVPYSFPPLAGTPPDDPAGARPAAPAHTDPAEATIGSARHGAGTAPAGPQQLSLLTALAGLLEQSHLADPEQLPCLASAAFQALGADVTMYLADHDLRLLVPAVVAPPLRAPPVAPPLGIDSTLAGRAFRQVQVLASDALERPRLWVPLLDGTERLGVLEVHLTDPAELADRQLRQQCQHLASLLGHLTTSMDARGDALDTARRLRPRTASAELVWQLLPPPTVENHRFSLSGWLEPADTVGGDIFDYALAPNRASVAVFDAMGHGLPAGLLAAAAVSAYRGARRNGHDLLAQARAVDQTISSVSPDGSFVTGFLGELDLTSGRLCYLNAGHPAALLLRDGKVVRPLAAGGRLPFGLAQLDASADPDERQRAQLGQEDLQPGDWLVVHTDGVTEARDATGSFFGDDRLADFLQRAAAAGQPPPETARRLAHAVLEHQGGQLQDDATVLLGRWLPD